MVKYLSICILLFVGCATVQEKWRVGEFEEVSSTYGQAIRWGSYEVAKSLIRTQGPDQEEPNIQNLRKIRVTSYELLNSNISEDKFWVQQNVKIQYYHTDYLIEKSLVDKQLWQYDETEETWYLRSGLPDFR